MNGYSADINFSNEDKIETIQSHDDALVVTLKIGGYDVKRVMVDQGSGVEIMYPDLYKGLNLRLEDLTAYNSHLVSFDGKVVIPRGMIRLPVQAGSEVVEVNFIVVDVYSPLHDHYSQTLAPCPGSCLLYSAPEGEISFRGLH